MEIASFAITQILFSILLISICCNIHSFAVSDLTNVTTVKIGALVDLTSITGKIALQAIQLAVNNENQLKMNSTLGGPVLELHIQDTNCSAFQGAAAAMELFKEEMVAIVGPQSSTTTYFIAHMATFLQVPLVSFGATDPTLSEVQYSLLLRMAHSDALQMAAIATLIQAYGWLDVRALHSDDDYGTNGIDALRDALEKRELLILHETAFSPGLDNVGIRSILSELNSTDASVFVVHMQGDTGMKVLSQAYNLGMMRAGFAWIVTDVITTTLGMMIHDRPDIVSLTQGVIGFRPHVSNSPQLEYFSSEWKKMGQRDPVTDWNASLFNIYGLYAYDAASLISRSIRRYVEMGGSFRFQDQLTIPNDAGDSTELARLKIFQGGLALKEEMLRTNFSGTSGNIKLDSRGNRLGVGFDIVNVVGNKLHTVGNYWRTTDDDGGSIVSVDGDDQRVVVLPGQSGRSTSQPLLLNIVWPGGIRMTPRGVLHIGVPWKLGFLGIVDVLKSRRNNGTAVTGLCIDVFVKALSYLPYNFTLKYVPYGNGLRNPNYDDLLQQLVEAKVDVVVGDVTVTSKRLELVDFTEPFIESGLVVLVSQRRSGRWSDWIILAPFSLDMWLTTFLWIALAGGITWVLEHRYRNDVRLNGHEDGRNESNRKEHNQPQEHLWFLISMLFFTSSEMTRTGLGRIAIAAWIIIGFIIQSSYTANLTSVLTAEKLSPPITGIDSLIASNLPIGYQTGSFVREYLLQLKVSANRLRPLGTRAMYAEALNRVPSEGGVAAIVDERPYVDLFLAEYCKFTIAGPEFARTGWGFAFPKHSKLTQEVSNAIVNMSANSVLEKIYDFWYRGSRCSNTRDSSASSTELGVTRFVGFFCVWGAVLTLCFIIHVVKSYIMFRSERGHVKLGANFCIEFWKHLFTPRYEKDMDNTEASRMENDPTR